MHKKLQNTNLDMKDHQNPCKGEHRYYYINIYWIVNTVAAHPHHPSINGQQY
jgi:hypothetical protein